MAALSGQEIGAVVFKLLQAPDPDTATDIIAQNKWLLQADFDKWLTQLIVTGCQQRNWEYIAQFTAVRGLLRLCQNQTITAVLARQPHWPLLENLPLQKLALLEEDTPPQQRVAWAALALADYTTPPENEELEIFGYINFHLGWGSHMLAKAGDEAARDNARSYLAQAIAIWQQYPSRLGQQFLPYAQAKLAYQLLKWPAPDQNDSTEKAIALLNDSLPDLPPGSIQHIDALICLGNACIQRLKPERVHNIETAIGYFKEALNLPTGEQERGAELHNNLAVAYRKRLAGSPVGNFQQAADHARQAIMCAEQTNDQESLGRTYAEMATLYAHYQGADRADRLEEAIGFADKALECFPQGRYPTEHSLVLLILGNLYCDRIKGNHRRNLEEAVVCFTAVSAARSPQKDPLGWAEAQNNLGTVYAELSRSANDSHYRQAIACFEQVTTICEKEQNFAFARLAAANWGFLAFRYNQWAEALTALNRALAAGENLFGGSFSELGRRVELADSSRLSPAAAYCLLKLKRPSSALIQLEKGKTRQLAAALALNNLDLQQFPAAQRDTISRLRQEIRALEIDLRPSTKTSIDPQTAARTRMLQEKQQALQNLTPAQSPLTSDDILALIPANGALIAPLITAQGSAAFILPHGTKAIEIDNVLWLNDFTEVALQPLFKEVRGKAITQTAHTLWTSLMGPIHQRLRALAVAPKAPVVILPQGGLAVLPLHAAKPPGKDWVESIAARYVVSYAPSAFVLQNSIAHQQTAVSKTRSLLAIINPTKDLIATEAELESLISNFPEEDQRHVLQGDAATKTAVLSSAANHSYLHFACHGAYDWENVMDSHLLLANGERLTLAAIIEELALQQTRLVTLSACETGITDRKQVPDEYLGLPGGFIQAGAPGIISTLWPVNDASTAIFMDQFYKNHLQGRMTPAEALHTTQLWFIKNTRDEMRDYYENLRIEAQSGDETSKKYLPLLIAATSIESPGDPYHWAPFIFSGSYFCE